MLSFLTGSSLTIYDTHKRIKVYTKGGPGPGNLYMACHSIIKSKCSHKSFRAVIRSGPFNLDGVANSTGGMIKTTTSAWCGGGNYKCELVKLDLSVLYEMIYGLFYVKVDELVGST